MSTRFDATRLGKGINLNEWLMLVSTGQGATSLPGWAKFLSDDPLERLHDSGLGHIRLPFDPLPLIPPLGNRTLSGWGALPDRGYLARVVASVLLAVAADIAVILVPRLDDAARHDELLNDPDTLAPLYAAFWGALARHLAERNIPPEMLAFELLNEPRFVQTTNGAGWANPTVANDIWLPIQGGWREAVRAAAPDHTVVLSADLFSSLRALVKVGEGAAATDLGVIRSLNDPNTIWTVHFYEPFVFTHQGADWGGDMGLWYGPIGGLVYPPSPPNCAGVRPSVIPKIQDEIDDYCGRPMDKDWLRDTLKPLVPWAQRHQRTLWAGEIGVFPDKAPLQSRTDYLGDLTAVLGELDIGFALYCYQRWCDRLDDAACQGVLA